MLLAGGSVIASYSRQAARRLCLGNRDQTNRDHHICLLSGIFLCRLVVCHGIFTHSARTIASDIQEKEYDPAMNEISTQRQARLFHALMHPARLTILNTLRDGEACVCHLEARLGYRQAYLSQQLAALRAA